MHVNAICTGLFAIIIGLQFHHETARAQTGENWKPGEGIPGCGNSPAVYELGGKVLASTMWDPDGAGPLSPRLIVAGRFALSGQSFVHRSETNVAMWDGSGWKAMGDEEDGFLNSDVNALFVWNGVLLAGGYAEAHNISLAPGLAKWVPSVDYLSGAWTDFAGGVNGLVYSMAVMPNGDLAVGGSFNEVGSSSLPAQNIATWNGTSWSALGTGFPTSCRALTLYQGKLVAGGDVVQQWDSTTSTWKILDYRPEGGMAVEAVVDYAGALVIGGVQVNSNLDFLRWWDGTSVDGNGSPVWNNFSILVDGPVYSLDVVGNYLYIGGSFSHAPGGTAANHIARGLLSSGSWTWSALGSGVESWRSNVIEVQSLTHDGNGNVYCVGQFSQAGDRFVTNVAKWDGSGWSSLGTGFNPVHTQSMTRPLSIGVSATLPNGDVIAGGRFSYAGGGVARGIA